MGADETRGAEGSGSVSGSRQMLGTAPRATQRGTSAIYNVGTPPESRQVLKTWQLEEIRKEALIRVAEHYFTSSYTGLAVILQNDTRHYSDLFPSVILVPPTWKNQTRGIMD